MLRTPKFWYENDIQSKMKSLILFPFSMLWILIIRFKISFTKEYKSKLKVICIGNLTVGGTGKTPYAIYTFKILKELGYNPVFLTRGYGSKNKGPLEVKKSHKFEDIGDEAILLSKVGTTIVSKNRSLGAKFIEKHNNNFNVIIMDDGLQNTQLKQDIKFLLIDKNLKFGNEFCLPAGPLRQPVNLGMTDIDRIILTGNYKRKDTNFFKHFNIPIIISKINVTNLPKIKDKNILAFCGLANPNKFYQTLHDNGYNISFTKSFPDHYSYRKIDIDNLILKANNHNLKLITTEKDYVKISKNNKLIHVLSIEMELSVKDKSNLKLFLREKLNV